MTVAAQIRAAERRRSLMHPEVGQVINNKYRLVRLIGDGGMGSVFEARHELLGTSVALKFLHPQLSRRKGLVDRFLQEAQVSARIKSPHVVRVADVDRTADGLAFMVMELIEGQTLQLYYEELYRRGERLSYGEAFDFMLQLLDGVEAAHRLGIVHRDLKPDNVMLAKDVRGNTVVKILDFGIAKLRTSGEMDRGLTRPGVVMGTPEYMAPEQAFSADRVDARADIFSLGVMFFEMLAGRRPVGGDHAHAIAAQYLERRIPNLKELKPTIADGVAAAVHKAMGPKPDERFGSVEEFRAAIEPFAPEGVAASVRAMRRSPTPAGDGTPLPGQPSTSAVPKTIPPDETFGRDTEKDEGATPPPPANVAPELARESDHSGEATRPLGAGTVPATPAAHPIGAGTQPISAIAAAALGESAPRPGGTMLGDSPLSAMPPTVGSPPLAAATAAPGQVPAVPFNPAGYPQPARSPRPARKGASFLSILLIAAGFSGLVVGGVYGAHHLSQRGASSGDPTPTPSPSPGGVEPAVSDPTTAAAPPLHDDLPPASTTTAPPPPPQPTTPPPQPTTPKPPPPPQPTTPPPQPTPTTPKPPPPPQPPPFVIPTSLPSGFPTLPPLFPRPIRTSPAPEPRPTNTTPPPPPPEPSTPKVRFPRLKVPRE